MKCPSCKKRELQNYSTGSMPSFEQAVANYCHEKECERQIVCDECYKNKNNGNKIWRLSKLHKKEEHNSVDLS